MTTLFLPQHLPWMRRNPLLLGVLLLLSVSQVSTARAAGVVTEPTETALNVAMQGGGQVTFACDGVIHITHTKFVGPGYGGDNTSNLTLDATGHNITLDGGGNVQILHAFTLGGFGGVEIPYSLTIKHLTLTNSSKGSTGGAIFVDSDTTLTLTDSAFVNNHSGTGGGAVYNAPKNSDSGLRWWLCHNEHRRTSHVYNP